jgi:hypothetical protein
MVENPYSLLKFLLLNITVKIGESFQKEFNSRYPRNTSENAIVEGREIVHYRPRNAIFPPMEFL